MRARILKSHHLEHLADLGYVNFPLRIRYEQAEYDAAVEDWKRSGVTDPKLLEAKALGHIYHRQQQQKDVSLTERAELHKHFRSLGRFVKAGLGAILIFLALLVFFSVQAHCQFSHVNNVTVTDGTTSLFTAAPFKIMFSGCTVSGTGSAMVVTCAGSAANPGGTAHQTQINSAGTAFAGVGPGTAGQVYESNGAGADPSFQDPIVSGPDAPGVAPTKNPVQIGLFDGTNVQRVLGSAAGRLSVDVNSAPTTAVTGTFFQATQPVSAASLPLPSGASTSAKQPALGTAGSASADVISIQGVASMTAVKTDGSGVTQPVSGTVSTTPPSNASTNVAQVAGTAADTNSGLKSAGTLRVVLATDQPALTNKLLVTPDSVALPANQSVNVNQMAGTATDTNSGVKSAGTLRVVLATDQPALTNKLLVTPDSVALPNNQSVNVSQVGGTAVVADPCAANVKVFFSFSGTASATLVTGTSAKKIYICSWQDQSAGAQNMAVVEGTGTVCATGIAAMPGLSGGTTAATGWNNAANGGRTYGDGGHSIAGEATNADNLCVLLSAAVQTNIGISYVVQ